MKKEYNTPEIDVEKFSIPNSVIITSGINDGNTEVELQSEF